MIYTSLLGFACFSWYPNRQPKESSARWLMVANWATPWKIGRSLGRMIIIRDGEVVWPPRQHLMPVITPAFPAMNCTCRGNEQMEMGRFLGCNEATNSRSFLVTRLKKLDIELIERFTLGVQSILTRMVLCFGKPASFGYSLHPVHYLIL